MARINGFQRPFDLLQIGTWVLYPLLIVGFYGFTVLYYGLVGRVLLGFLYGICSLASVYNAYRVCAIDPIDGYLALNRKDGSRAPAHIETSFCFLCQIQVKPKSRHCRYCNKCVEGFDHHCKWLNTCVGSKNYQFFLRVLVFTSAYVVIHLAATLYPIIDYFTRRSHFSDRVKDIYGDRGDSLSEDGLCSVNIVMAVLQVSLLFPLGQLVVFHTLLLFRSLTTYEYILEQHERIRAKQREAQKRLEEQQQQRQQRQQQQQQQQQQEESQQDNQQQDLEEAMSVHSAKEVTMVRRSGDDMRSERMNNNNYNSNSNNEGGGGSSGVGSGDGAATGGVGGDMGNAGGCLSFCGRCLRLIFLASPAQTLPSFDPPLPPTDPTGTGTGTAAGDGEPEASAGAPGAADLPHPSHPLLPPTPAPPAPLLLSSSQSTSRSTSHRSRSRDSYSGEEGEGGVGGEEEDGGVGSYLEDGPGSASGGLDKSGSTTNNHGGDGDGDGGGCIDPSEGGGSGSIKDRSLEEKGTGEGEKKEVEVGDGDGVGDDVDDGGAEEEEEEEEEGNKNDGDDAGFRPSPSLENGIRGNKERGSGPEGASGGGGGEDAGTYSMKVEDSE